MQGNTNNDNASVAAASVATTTNESTASPTQAWSGAHIQMSHVSPTNLKEVYMLDTGTTKSTKSNNGE